MHKRTFWRIIFWISIIGAVICVAVSVWYYWSRYQSAQKYEELRQEVLEGSGDTDGQDDTAQAEPGANPTLEEVENAEFTGQRDGPAPRIPEEVLTDAEESPVDFEKLQAINPELYAWIRVPGTQINYPVAQHEGEEQQFYLHHDLYGTPQFVGCIFSQEPNAKDFSDPVTVLYGHNMRNGSMFQNLHLYTQADAFKNEHNYVYVYMPNKMLIYEIYSAYAYDNRNILETNDFSDSEVFDKYIQESLKPHSMIAKVKDGIKVTTDDKILTLSTCITGQPGQRLLVQAVLLYGKDE